MPPDVINFFEDDLTGFSENYVVPSVLPNDLFACSSL